MQFQNEQQQKIKQNYQHLRNKLLSKQNYPSINKVFNLPQFIKENQKLYEKLIKEINEAKHRKQTIESRIKITNPKVPLNRSFNSHSQAAKLSQIKSENEALEIKLEKMKFNPQQKSNTKENNDVAQKLKKIDQKSKQLQYQTNLLKQLQRANENNDLLELYDQKCRQCESLRKVNNQITQQLKKSINQMNKLTGNQENANMFLMNLVKH